MNKIEEQKQMLVDLIERYERLKKRFGDHPCCRCGVCCLSSTCGIAQDIFGIGSQTPCPALAFDSEGLAICKLALENKEMAIILGVGIGCCLKARCIKNGMLVESQFRTLPDQHKLIIAEQIKKNIFKKDIFKKKVSKK